MKKLMSILSMVCFIATISMAQAVMTLEKTEMDYGTIEQGAEPTREFRFKNTGTEPLIIKNAKGSCGCTVPDAPKEPIMPGQSNKVIVRYDTNRVGPFTKTITLTTNEAVDQRILTIKGEVKAKPAQPDGVPAQKANVLTPKEK